MPKTCDGCSAPLPEKAAFCPRCGRAAGPSVVVKESAESLQRQVASMMQKHSRRKLVAKFIGGRWGNENTSPFQKAAAIRLHTGRGIFDTSRAFVVRPSQGKILFPDGSWADITMEVLQEEGFEDARAFAEEFTAHSGRRVEILKKYM